MLGEVWRFIVAVIGHWQGLVTGGLITALVLGYVVVSGQQLPRWFYLVLFLAVFFPMSCFLAWRDEHRMAARFEADQDETAVARHRAEGVQLFARPVTSNAELETWQRDYATWYEAAKHRVAPFPEPIRLKFENLGSILGGLFGQAFNPDHNRQLIFLSRQLEILQEIAEGRGRRE
jgi:hypothetical protein